MLMLDITVPVLDFDISGQRRILEPLHEPGCFTSRRTCSADQIAGGFLRLLLVIKPGQGLGEHKGETVLTTEYHVFYSWSMELPAGHHVDSNAAVTMKHIAGFWYRLNRPTLCERPAHFMETLVQPCGSHKICIATCVCRLHVCHSY